MQEVVWPVTVAEATSCCVLVLDKGYSAPGHPFPRCVHQKVQAVCSRLVKARLTFAFLALTLKYERLKISCIGVAPGQ